MKNLSLRYRLLLLTLLPSLLIALSLVAYFTFGAVSALERELKAKGLATVRYLAPVSEYGIIAGQIDALQGLTQVAALEPGTKAALVVSEKGKLLAVSGRVSLPAEILKQTLSQEMLVEETAERIAFGAPVKRSLNSPDVLFDPVPLEPEAPEIIGRVFIEYDKTELARQQSQLIMRGLAIALFGLLLIAVLAIAMADMLSRPVMRLVDAVRRMSTGQLDTRLPATSSGEIGILESGFNDMADNLQEAHRSMLARIEAATAELAFQASHDELTGLVNRREFEQRLEKALAATQGGGTEFAVLFMDLDSLKRINDAGGHLAGDEMLRQMALLIGARLHEADTLARFGGDEFCVLLPNSSHARARQVANDILHFIRNYRFVWKDKIFGIGANIGLTVATRKARKPADILTAADTACQQARSHGGEQVCEAAVEPERPVADDSQWLSQLARALDEHLLVIDAMPLQPLQARDEAMTLVTLSAHINLAGQRHIPFRTLIEAAERNGLAEEIDQYLLNAAIEAQAKARQTGRRFRCLIPLSETSLENRTTIDWICARLAARKLSGDWICFLFPEEWLTRQTGKAIRFGQMVEERLGARVGVVDFGGGLSSFSHLRSIQPEFIRLSRSIAQESQKSRPTLALLRAIREIAADQHTATIADGVDDGELREHLRLQGVDYAMGLAAGATEPFDVWFEGVVMRSRAALPF